MGRWMKVLLATTCCVLILAAAQRSPWVTRQAGQLHALHQDVRQSGMLRLGGITIAVPWAVERVPPNPFALVRSPSWSKTDAAVAQLQRRLTDRPDDPAAARFYAQLGSAYLQKARETGDPSYYTRAEGSLQKSLALVPDDPSSMVAMGSLHLARHSFAAALEWAERALRLDPTSYHAHGVAGDAAIELGRYTQAFASFQKMGDLRPGLASYSRASYSRELLGDLPGAIEAMRLAVSAGAPQDEATNWARVQLGHLSFLTGDLDGAEREYELSLRLLPGYVHGLGGLGKVAAARGNLSVAAGFYTRALAVAPVAEYAIALGSIHQASGNHAAATQQNDLVRVIAQLQRDGGVDLDLEMALFEVDHTNDGAAIAAAVRTVRTHYQQRPSIFAADALAWSLYRTGEWDEALPYAREALRLDSKDPLLLYHAGVIAAAAGQPIEARGYLEESLARNPRFHVRLAPEAKRLIDQLSSQLDPRVVERFLAVDFS